MPRRGLGQLPVTNNTQRSARRVSGEAWHLAAGITALAAITSLYRLTLVVTNPTVVGLSYLLVVLLVGAASTLRVAVTVSVVAVLGFNYFFLPPVGTLTLDDPENWVALLVFLAVSVVASRLSLTARTRADEATARRDEMGRLFDLSRDVLLTTDSRDAVDALARYMARRFVLDYVSVCLPSEDGWQIHESAPGVDLDRNQLDLALATARGTLEFDAQARSYGGHRHVKTGDGTTVTLVPLRLGTRAVGLLAASGRPVEPGTLDAMAGLAAIAMERANLLEERKSAELLRQSAELKSALLASLGHDLKTPLTAITVAARNLDATWLTDVQRREQLDVVLTEVERLNRLFQNIVDMARIETGAVNAEREWVQPSDIVEAAVQQVEHAVADHPLEIDAVSDLVVQVDPRLTSAALAHIIENAGHYSPAGSAITIGAKVTDQGLLIAVRDRGPGIAPPDREHLFERFYRGADARRRAFGTGMGLAITRGLLAAQDGRVWADNDPGGGAVFTVVVPAPSRAEVSIEPETE
jgi:two-component system sensor histidine kinase KdpD